MIATSQSTLVDKIIFFEFISEIEGGMGLFFEVSFTYYSCVWQDTIKEYVMNNAVQLNEIPRFATNDRFLQNTEYQPD